MTIKTFAFAAALLAVAAAPAAQGAEGGSSAILRLINTRAAGSTKAFAEAAEAVARYAAEGKVLHQYVIAVVQGDPALPPSARLSPETRRLYLDAARGRIRALAESRGNTFAWYLLSLESNDVKMLKRAADGGNVQALNAWGTLTLTKALCNPSASKEDRDMALERGFSCFSRAAGEKDANGMYNLGMCCLRGYGCPENPGKALDCFRSAAEQGHTEAVNNIGGMYRDGIFVDKDLVMAAKWFAKSAEMGNAYGQLNYALALKRGEGVGKDEKRAAELIKMAADQGSVEALNEYGRCLADGTGVEKDEAAAVACFRDAAEKGFPLAMESLAYCFEAGVGGLEKSVKEATVWKVRARAARGDRNAAAWLSQNGYGMK